VLERGAHYVLALKGNQSKLFAEVERCFTRSGKRSAAQRVEPSTHDRHESRRATVMRNISLGATNRFPGVAAVARITSRRRLHGKPAGKPSVRYYLLSKYLPAQRLLQIVRGHWSIENACHWVLDMTFREDESRIRERHLRENFAWLNRFVLSLLKQHLGRQSLVMKRRSCGWSDDFLMQVVTGSTC